MKRHIYMVGACALSGLALGASQTTASAQKALNNNAIETIIPQGWEDTYNSIHYAPAVRAGDLLILSGVVAGSREGQTEEQSYTKAFKVIESILTEGGATWDDVIEIQTFHTDLPAQINTFSAVKDKFIKKPYPAWTAIDIDRLYPDNGLVEIKITAYLGGK